VNSTPWVGPDRNPTTRCCLLDGAGGRGLRLRRTRLEAVPEAGPQSGLVRRSVCKAISVNLSPEIPGVAGGSNGSRRFPEHDGSLQNSRDLASISVVDLVPATALELMSAAAVHLGLAQDLPAHRNLPEARALIDSLAGLLSAAAPHLGHHRATPLWDGLRTLQLAYREVAHDEPGAGPGERFTGPVSD
jgi:Domain of unknown function (DUF1844)